MNIKTSYKIILENIALVGIVVMICLWLTDHYFEWRNDTALKGRLMYELEFNLVVINENIASLQKYDKNKNIGEVEDFSLLESEIFNSMVGSNKITILDNNFAEELIGFYNEIESINYARKQRSSSIAVIISALGRAKTVLRNINDFFIIYENNKNRDRSGRIILGEMSP